MSHLTLVSHQLCPYVQRAAIALAEKNVLFTRIDVDLAEKPDWFTAISPLGKVPLLRVGDAVIFESAVILEYLEETAGHPMHPEDALARARHRAWIEFASATLDGIWRFYSAPDDEALESEGRRLRERFRWLDRHLGAGPYFARPRFHLVDTAWGPVFRYLDAFDRIADFGLLDGLSRTAAYRAALAARPSVGNAVDEGFSGRLSAFLRARGSALSRRMTVEAA